MNRLRLKNRITDQKPVRVVALNYQQKFECFSEVLNYKNSMAF